MKLSFFSSRRRHTRCALVTGVRRVLFRSQAGFPGRSGQRPRWCARGVGATAAHQQPRRTRAVEPMTVASSKWMLAAIWLVGAGGVFRLLVAQSLLGRYEPATHEVWGWFLPTVMQTLSLIVGVLVADRRVTGHASVGER